MKTKALAVLLSIACISFMLAGLSIAQDKSQTASADRKFAMTAAMDGMTEVELGRLAVQKGASDAVKQFGQRMIDDHSKANQELTQIASTKGITLPTQLDAKQTAMVAKFNGLSGDAFDREYMKLMVKDHRKAVDLFQREASGGADADLKAFAAKTLPTLQEHLSMAEGNNNGSNANSNSNNSNRR